MDKAACTRRDAMAMLAWLASGFASTASATTTSSPGDRVDPGVGKVIFENDRVRVISHLARPRMGVCGTGLHSHPPHLTVVLTDATARVMLPGKEPFIDTQKAGAVFWDPGGPHRVENLGSRDTKVYLVELKS